MTFSEESKSPTKSRRAGETLIILTDEERDRFAKWCEINAESADGMASQLEQHPVGTIAVLAKQLKFEAAACAFTAKKLRSTETFTVGKDDQAPSGGGE